MLFEVLCYRNRTQTALGRLLSQVPGLEPPIGFCSTRPSDTIKTRLLHANFLVEDVQRRRSVHFHVEAVGYHRDLLDELVDQHTPFVVRRGLPRLVAVECSET